MLGIYPGFAKKKVNIQMIGALACKAPNTSIDDFANAVVPDETAHYELSNLDLQCLPSSLRFFKIIQFILKVFRKFADRILSSAFLALYELVLKFDNESNRVATQYPYPNSLTFH